MRKTDAPAVSISAWAKAILAAALMTASVLSASCSDRAHTEEASHGHEEEHEGHEHHEHGEEEEESDLHMSVDEIKEAACEHDVHTYECAECRYEVGVVRIDPAVAAESSGAESLISFEKAVSAASGSLLVTTGEVGFDENRTVRVRVPVDGVVSSVKVDIGDKVSEGDPLFEMNSPELVEIAADYVRASEMAYLSGKNYRREKDLYQKQISSEREMLEAKMEYREHRAELESARQRLYSLGLSEDDLKKGNNAARGVLVVRSPLGGEVIEKDVAVNERVMSGDRLMVVSDPETLWVWADIYESDLGSLPPVGDSGVPVEIRLEAFPGRVFKGKLDYVAAVMEESTRTVKVRAVVDNSDRLLRAGMFCEVSIPRAESVETVLAPRSAVLSDEGESFVFKHLEGDYWVRRPVVTGREYGDKVEIKEGLAAGEVIASEGAFLLKSDVLREKMGAGCAD